MVAHLTQILVYNETLQIKSNQIKSNQFYWFKIQSWYCPHSHTVHKYKYNHTESNIQFKKYVHVKHHYQSPIITLNKCIRHISVAPLYIMGVKRWVQVCTCTDLSVQIHPQSNPSWHHIPVITCIWLHF